MVIFQLGYKKNPANAPQTTNKIEMVCVIGDSIAAGTNSGEICTASKVNFADIMSKQMGASIWNFAAPNSTTYEVLQQAKAMGYCDLAIIEVGANDVFQKTKPFAFKNDLESILEIVKIKAKRIILVGLPDFGQLQKEFNNLLPSSPVYGKIVRNSSNVQMFRDFDKIIEETAKENGVDYLPLFGFKFSRKELGADSFHPGPEGHKRIAQALLSKVPSLKSWKTPETKTGADNSWLKEFDKLDEFERNNYLLERWEYGPMSDKKEEQARMLIMQAKTLYNNIMERNEEWKSFATSDKFNEIFKEFETLCYKAKEAFPTCRTFADIWVPYALIQEGIWKLRPYPQLPVEVSSPLSTAAVFSMGFGGPFNPAMVSSGIEKGRGVASHPGQATGYFDWAIRFNPKWKKEVYTALSDAALFYLYDDDNYAKEIFLDMAKKYDDPKWSGEEWYQKIQLGLKNSQQRHDETNKQKLDDFRNRVLKKK